MINLFILISPPPRKIQMSGVSIVSILTQKNMNLNLT